MPSSKSGSAPAEITDRPSYEDINPVADFGDACCFVIDSVDQVRDFAPEVGIESYCAQLGEGPSEARVMQESRGPATLTRIAFDAPLYLRARSLPNRLLLGTCQSASRSSINGLPIKSQHCFLVMPGAEIDVFTSQPATFRMISIPDAAFGSNGDSQVGSLREAMAGRRVYAGGSRAQNRPLAHCFESWEKAVESQDAGAHSVVQPLISGVIDNALKQALRNLQNRKNHLVTDMEWAGGGVKRLIDYFHDNPEHWISIDDACQLAQMGRRNLYYQFRKHTGLSPQKYFSRIRLSYLRQELITCESSITELALKYNFHHLGDFSASYRAVYGELPSDTRKNAMDADQQNSLEQLNWRRA